MKTVIFCYTRFVKLLPNPIVLMSEVYSIWNRVKDEIADPRNIALSEKSIHIISVVSYYDI